MKPRTMNARHIASLMAVALLAAATQTHGANPTGPLDLPPSNVIPAPVDMMPPSRPAVPSQAPAPERQAEPAAAPRDPSGNPLWSIPLSSLTATRERPLFTPSRRAPAPAVAAAPIVAPAARPQPPAEPERPNLALVGAIAGSGESYAVFLDQTNNNVVRLRTGQDHLGWVLRTVKGREATLQKGSETATIALPPPGGPQAMPMPSLPGPMPGAPPLPGAQRPMPIPLVPLPTGPLDGDGNPIPPGHQ